MESFLKSLPENFELHEFKLERVLGQGGFGITYLALDTNLMQHVAIKEYFPREFSSRDSTFTIHAVGNAEDKDTFSWGLKRFLAEARVLAQLSHANIVSIKRFFEAHGTAYLVMEYCDGKPLDEIIRDRGPLNESQLNEILFPLLDGLEHVHGKAFLHRDVKPANIFIRRDGKHQRRIGSKRVENKQTRIKIRTCMAILQSQNIRKVLAVPNLTRPRIRRCKQKVFFLRFIEKVTCNVYMLIESR